MNLPPFSQTFYSSYHSPTGAHGGGSGQGMHNLPHTMGYGGHMPMGAPGQPYHYPVTSPVAMNAPSLSGNHRAPPPHSYSESPRLPGGYSSSPGVRHLSPTSPTTHLIPPGITASSASSSSYPSVTKTPAVLPKSKRRSTSASQSESWDEDMKYGKLDSTDDQPWGMPQDEYKALNPRDKKQVRNR
jgi:hypothetical protein